MLETTCMAGFRKPLLFEKTSFNNRNEECQKHAFALYFYYLSEHPLKTEKSKILSIQ